MEPWHVWRNIELEREPARTLRRRLEAGAVVRVSPGWFVDIEAWEGLAPWDRRALVAHVFALAHPGVALADGTALAARGLPTFDRNGTALHVQRPGGRPRGRWLGAAGGQGLKGRWRLLEHDRDDPVQLLDGVPVVGPIWAASHVAAGHDVESAVVALDGVRRHLLLRGDAEDELRRSLEGLPQAAARKRASVAWEASTSLSESAGETLARVRMIRLGFEPPELQLVVTADGHRFRPDYAWRSLALLGEFDGQGKYAGNEGAVRRAEKEREEALRRAGFRVFRLSWADISNPHALRKALSANGVPPAVRDERGNVRRFR